MVSALSRLWIDQCRFKPWPGTMHCVLGQDTLLSWCLFSPWLINGNDERCWGLTLRWSLRAKALLTKISSKDSKAPYPHISYWQVKCLLMPKFDFKGCHVCQHMQQKVM